MFVGVHIGSMNFMTIHDIRGLLTSEILLLTSDDDRPCFDIVEVMHILTNKVRSFVGRNV